MAPLLFHTGAEAFQQLRKREEQKKEDEEGLGTASIVGIVVFVVFSVGFIVSITAYCIHKRRERNKLPPEKRPTSYRPFRTNSAQSSLLSNAADPSEDHKSSMFSRGRGSSVSLYVESGAVDRRASMDSLIPLRITAAEEVHEEASHGTGVSGSSRYSETTSGSLGIRAIPLPQSEESDLGTRPTGRTRSTSTASTRYYEQNAIDPAPQIPKIVHTLSD